MQEVLCRPGRTSGTGPRVPGLMCTFHSFFAGLCLDRYYDCRVDPNFEGSQCRLASPHSNAVVDLNGDCLAGMYIPNFLHIP